MNYPTIESMIDEMNISYDTANRIHGMMKSNLSYNLKLTVINEILNGNGVKDIPDLFMSYIELEDSDRITVCFSRESLSFYLASMNELEEEQ